MLWMQERGTQEVGMSKHEKEKARGSSTAAKSMEEDEKAQWSKGAAPKGSNNVYGRMDDEEGGGNLCEVQKIQLQRNED